MEEYRLQFLSARTYSGRAYRVGELMEYRGEKGIVSKVDAVSPEYVREDECSFGRNKNVL